MPEKSKNISFRRYSKFPFLYRREARDLDQAQTSAMNTVKFVCFDEPKLIHRNGNLLPLSCN